MTDPKPRTLRQNNSIHLWFEHIANEMNDAGIDMQIALREQLPVWWTGETIKKVMFKAALKAVYPGKTSTTQLTTKELAALTEMFQAAIAKKFGVNVDVPSIETMQKSQTERIWK